MSPIDARAYSQIVEARLKFQQEQVNQLVNRSGAVAGVLALVAAASMQTVLAMPGRMPLLVTLIILLGLLSGLPVLLSRLLAEGPDPKSMHRWYQQHPGQFYQLLALASATAVEANGSKVADLERLLRWQAALSGASVVVTFAVIQLGS